MALVVQSKSSVGWFRVDLLFWSGTISDNQQSKKRKFTVVKLNGGGFHPVLTRIHDQRQMKHRAFMDITLIESSHLVTIFQFFFNMAHKRICYHLSEERAHGKPVHLFVQISFKLEKLFFRSNL